MSKGDKKNRRQYEKVKEEWIEMEDLNEPKNKALTNKFVAEEGSDYQEEKMKREAEEREYRLKQAEILKQKYEKSQKVLQNKKNYQQVIQVQRKPKKTPTMPMIEVTCDFCTVPQSVPGNTQLYICGSCQNMNQSYPLYGICICGVCQSKVGFGFGMYDYIKCPQCDSINKVPLQAPKNYEAMAIPPLKQNNLPARRQNQRQRQREYDYNYAGMGKNQDLI